MEKEKLCLRCMRKIGDNTVCPYCKNEKSQKQEPPFLPLKTVVGGKYLIGKLVSSNAEGSTYYAFDLSLKRPVTLREFYPRELVARGEDNYCLVNVGKASAFIDEKSEFLKLWNTLENIRGYSALFEIYDVFEDLGTAYAAYEYSGEMKTLREYLLATEQGFLSWEDTRVLLMPVLSGLEAVHEAGIIHRGISPETLLVSLDGRVKISGFSVPDLRNEKSPLEAELFDGSAAVEQYGFDGKQGPLRFCRGALQNAYRQYADERFGAYRERQAYDSGKICRKTPRICNKRTCKRASDIACRQNGNGRSLQR